MSRYRRSQTTGGMFFFTLSTYRRRPILLEPDVRTALREAIQQICREMPFEIHGWVLLPDHLHCIWELPPGDAAFGRRWGMIKRHVTRACPQRGEDSQTRTFSQEKRRERLFWQRRFWEHRIRDDQDLERHMDYIHWNPVKHRHVSRVGDWPYSTFHRYVKAGIYAGDWGGENLRDPGAGSFGE